MKEINKELLTKILEVYEFGTKENLEKIEKMFEEQRPRLEKHRADMITSLNSEIFAKWSTIFKIRDQIKQKKHDKS